MYNASVLGDFVDELDERVYAEAQPLTRALPEKRVCLRGAFAHASRVHHCTARAPCPTAPPPLVGRRGASSIGNLGGTASAPAERFGGTGLAYDSRAYCATP